MDDDGSNISKSKNKISIEYTDSDGTKGTRSTFADFQTVMMRGIKRIKKIAPESESVLMPGVWKYMEAEYEKALSYFLKAVEEYPQLSVEIAPYIEICERVAKTEKSYADLKYENNINKWRNTGKFAKVFKSKPKYKIRCKYCGHYTTYIDPMVGLAYMGTNNCYNCGRGYPVPHFSWDGIDGQAYIYYRHSVSEAEFYAEFEVRYDVEQDHTYFLEKKR